MTRAKGVIKFQAADSYLWPACNTKLNIAISYGGPAWPISDTDLNLGAVSSGLCLGAIFDITAGSNVKPTSGTPEWIVGDTFLVRFFLILRSFSHPDQSVFSTRTEKCVHCLPLQPAGSGLCTTLKRSWWLLRFAKFLLSLCYRLYHAHTSFHDLGSPSTTVSGPAGKATSGSSPASSCEYSFYLVTLSC